MLEFARKEFARHISASVVRELRKFSRQAKATNGDALFTYLAQEHLCSVFQHALREEIPLVIRSLQTDLTQRPAPDLVSLALSDPDGKIGDLISRLRNPRINMVEVEYDTDVQTIIKGLFGKAPTESPSTSSVRAAPGEPEKRTVSAPSNDTETPEAAGSPVCPLPDGAWLPLTDPMAAKSLGTKPPGGWKKWTASSPSNDAETPEAARYPVVPLPDGTWHLLTDPMPAKSAGAKSPDISKDGASLPESNFTVDGQLPVPIDEESSEDKADVISLKEAPSTRSSPPNSDCGSDSDPSSTPVHDYLSEFETKIGRIDDGWGGRTVKGLDGQTDDGPDGRADNAIVVDEIEWLATEQPHNQGPFAHAAHPQQTVEGQRNSPAVKDFSRDEVKPVAHSLYAEKRPQSREDDPGLPAESPLTFEEQGRSETKQRDMASQEQPQRSGDDKPVSILSSLPSIAEAPVTTAPLPAITVQPSTPPPPPPVTAGETSEGQQSRGADVVPPAPTTAAPPAMTLPAAPYTPLPAYLPPAIASPVAVAPASAVANAVAYYQPVMGYPLLAMGYPLPGPVYTPLTLAYPSPGFTYSLPYNTQPLQTSPPSSLNGSNSGTVQGNRPEATPQEPWTDEDERLALERGPVSVSSHQVAQVALGPYGWEHSWSTAQYVAPTPSNPVADPGLQTAYHPVYGFHTVSTPPIKAPRNVIGPSVVQDRTPSASASSQSPDSSALAPSQTSPAGLGNRPLVVNGSKDGRDGDPYTTSPPRPLVVNSSGVGSPTESFRTNPFSPLVVDSPGDGWATNVTGLGIVNPSSNDTVEIRSDYRIPNGNALGRSTSLPAIHLKRWKWKSDAAGAETVAPTKSPPGPRGPFPPPPGSPPPGPAPAAVTTEAQSPKGKRVVAQDSADDGDSDPDSHAQSRSAPKMVKLLLRSTAKRGKELRKTKFDDHGTGRYVEEVLEKFPHDLDDVRESDLNPEVWDVSDNGAAVTDSSDPYGLHEELPISGRAAVRSQTKKTRRYMPRKVQSKGKRR